MKKRDVWFVELADAQGHEQKGDRPAIVLGKANAMVIAIPLTTNTSRAALSHTLVIEPTNENGLNADSVALAFQLRALDKTRFKHKTGEITSEQAKAIDELLKELLGMARE